MQSLQTKLYNFVIVFPLVTLQLWSVRNFNAPHGLKLIQLGVQVDAFVMQVDAFVIQVDAFTMQVNAFTMQVDTFTILTPFHCLLWGLLFAPTHVGTSDTCKR